jgi:hypothetical protein
MPKSPKRPSQPARNPSPNIDVDKGVGDDQLEDRVGRRPDEKPDMVPPGQDRDEIANPGSKPDQPDEEAIEADRATQRRSDRTDARDGVDASDTIPLDPDSLGGRRRS